MSPWYAKLVFFLGVIGMAIVRAPHIKRSTAIKVVKSRNDILDKALVAFVSLGLVLPLVWMTTSAIAIADYALRPIPFGAGVLCFACGLWVLHRSHVDLGTNWSNTLELREGHRLVVEGVYRRVRHPMYVALLLYGLGQSLTLPNFVAGPSFFVPFAILVAVRMHREERMMLEKFGADYEVYVSRTKRLIPGVW